MAACGQQPAAPADLYVPEASTSTDDVLTRIKGVHQWVRDHIVQAQDEQAVRANDLRREARFKEGDMVLLNTHARRLLSQRTTR